MAGIIDLATYAFRLELDDKNFSSGLKGAESRIENASSGIQGKLGGMASFLKTSVVAGIASVGVALGGMAIAGLNSALKLDDTMAKFRASTGVTAEETNKVKDAIKDLYKVNQDSYEDIAKMAEALHNNMQMSADDIKKYAQNYLDYAKVTKQSDEEAVQAIDDFGDAWGLANDQVLPIMDKLKYSQEQYGLSVEESQGALKNLAPALQGLKIDVNQAVSYLDLFASTGIDSTTAVTAFQYALKQVKSPDELKKAIIDLQNTQNATERAQKAVELFGARAGVGMANALKPGTQSIEDIMNSLQKADGAVSKASKNYDSSLKVQLDLLRKQLSGLFTDLGDKLAPLVQGVVSWLQTNMPKIQTVLTTVFDVVGGAIGFVIDIISSLIQSFKNFFSSNMDDSNQYKTYMNDFKVWFSDIFSSLKEIVQTILSAITEFWKKHGEEITAVVKPIWEAIKTIISTAMKLIRDIINVVAALIKGDWGGIWKGIKQIFIDIWEGIKNLVPNLLEGVYNQLKLSFSILQDIGAKMFNFIWDGMKSIWDGIVNWVSEKVNWLIDKLTFWDNGKNKMNESSVSTTSKSLLPSYDIGTTFVPFDQVAIIHKGEAIIPAQYNPFVNEKKGLSSNSTTYNVTVQNMTVQAEDSDSAQTFTDNILSGLPTSLKRNVQPSYSY